MTSGDTQVVSHTGQTLRWQSVTYTSINYRMRSNINKVDYDYSRFAYYPDQSNFNYGQVQWRSSLRESGSSSGPWDVFLYPFPAKNEPGYFEYFPILNIQGMDYFEVGVFQSDPVDLTVQLPNKLSYNVGHDGLSKYYWAKGFGLIMIESRVHRFDTKEILWQKWELVRSNLIQ